MPVSGLELPDASREHADLSINGSMAPAEINWRPLGELFLEHGLITRGELEDALAGQAETKERLGQVLVTKGLVSEPELLKVLVDQLGLELEQEGGPGRLADDVTKRRALRSLEPAPTTSADPEDNGSVAGHDPIAAARASFEAALAEERKQLEGPLNEARAALHASLSRAPLEPVAQATEKPIDPAETVPEVSELVPAAPQPASAPEPSDIDEQPSVDVMLLVRQADELREELARETASQAATLKNATEELDSQVTDLRAALSHERELHRRAAEELERMQSDARREAAELRAAVNRLRADLAQVDAATGWFEYWSGAADRSSRA